MPTISYETINEFNLLVENYKKEIARLKEENKNLDETCTEVISEYGKLEKENEYLKQRNKDLRQKSWIQVYEENLKLTEEIKQYQATLQAVETFIGRFSSERR